MDWAERIGARIREARERRGWTLEKLSLETGEALSVSRISNYEQGRRTPPRNAIGMLAEALDVTPAWLECYTDDPRSSSALSEDEKRLLDKYRGTDDRGRSAIHSIADAQPEQHKGAQPAAVKDAG